MNTTAIERTPPLRVDWRRVEDIKAMTLAALGTPVGVIAEDTKLTASQVQYRMRKAGIRLRDFRYRVPSTLGGRLNKLWLGQAVRAYQPMVESTLKKPMPTKREARQGGNGQARATLADFD